ncbi:unnamed protein product [Urochloa humidicola]
MGKISEDEGGMSIQIVHPFSNRVRIVSVGIDGTTYDCSRNMFYRDGLLCPHILKVFTNRDVEEIPEKYLLRSWSKEATNNIPEHLSGPEPSFEVPTTNKPRYNALCRKMMGLAAGPEKYSVPSKGIDHLFQVLKELAILQMDRDMVLVNGESEGAEAEGHEVQFKNPPRVPQKGHPKDKVDRKKSIVQQVRGKVMKKKATTKKKKIMSCSYCQEDGHGVQTCKYMAKAYQIVLSLKESELKL